MAKGIENRARSPPAVFDFATSQIQKHGGTKMYYDLVESGKRINGKPIEGQVINRAFNKLIEEKGLPKVVFHSLRHSSITYKLKLNGGDMKSVQGDSGHAQVKMVADVYSHIIDDDRRLNAERMEAAFYSGRQATPEPVQPAATESSADDKELLLKLLQNPEMAALLKSLAKTL